MAKTVKTRAKRRGFASISEYVRFLLDQDEDLISADELLAVSRRAESEYGTGKLKKLSSLEELIWNAYRTNFIWFWFHQTVQKTSGTDQNNRRKKRDYLQKQSPSPFTKTACAQRKTRGIVFRFGNYELPDNFQENAKRRHRFYLNWQTRYLQPFIKTLSPESKRFRKKTECNA